MVDVDVCEGERGKGANWGAVGDDVGDLVASFRCNREGLACSLNDRSCSGTNRAVWGLSYGYGEAGCCGHGEGGFCGVDACRGAVCDLEEECPIADCCGAWERVVGGIRAHGYVLAGWRLLIPLVRIRRGAGCDWGGCYG